MTDTALKLTAGALPYSDGSGHHQVNATVEQNDEGLMLRFEMVHMIPIEKWSEARDVIQALVESAKDIDRVRRRIR